MGEKVYVTNSSDDETQSTNHDRQYDESSLVVCYNYRRLIERFFDLTKKRQISKCEYRFEYDLRDLSINYSNYSRLQAKCF